MQYACIVYENLFLFDKFDHFQLALALLPLTLSIIISISKSMLYLALFLVCVFMLSFLSWPLQCDTSHFMDFFTVTFRYKAFSDWSN